jgi:hypothetical protein
MNLPAAWSEKDKFSLVDAQVTQQKTSKLTLIAIFG